MNHLSAVLQLISAGADFRLSDTELRKFNDLIVLQSELGKEILSDLGRSTSYATFIPLRDRIIDRLKVFEPTKTDGRKRPLSRAAEDEFNELTWLKDLTKAIAEHIYLDSEERELLRNQEVKRKCIVCDLEKSLLDGDARGPSDCTCFFCDECTGDYLKFLIDRNGDELSLCPGCKGVVQRTFLQRSGLSLKVQKKFLKRQLAYGLVKSPGWRPCPTEDCLGGRIVLPNQKAYFSCIFCDWKGCLNCGTDHNDRMNCATATQHAREMKAKLEKMIELGKLATPIVPTFSKYA